MSSKQSVREKVMELQRQKAASKKPAKPGGSLKTKIKKEINGAKKSGVSGYSSDMDTMRKTLDKMVTGGFFKPEKNSEYILRVLPAWREGGVFYKEIRHHWITTPDGSRTKIQCVENEEGERLLGFPCFICDKARRMVESADEGKRKAGIRLQPSVRYALNVIDFTNDPPKIGLVWEAPKTVVRYLVGLIFDEKKLAIYGDVTETATGRNLMVNRDDVGNAPTKYTLTPLPDKSRVKVEHVKKTLKDLDEYYKYPKQEELQAAADSMIIDTSADGDF